MVMKKLSNWDARIGRRVRLRDLHILLSVVQHGSMAKAAANLSVSQPAISDAIATLETALGVRLLDRSRRGVEPTAYGVLLLKYGQMAIDDLRQGVKEIEFLADPTAGELRVGCPESVTNGPLVPIIERLAERYPRVRVHVEQFATPMFEFPALEQRKVDLVIARLNPPPGGYVSHTVQLETLFDDRFCIAVGTKSALARRDAVELADLVKERWIMTPADSPGGVAVQRAFLDAGLPPPEFMVSTFSVFLRNTMVASGKYVSALPASVLRLNTDKLRDLPIALPMPRWLVAAVTLKNRPLNPAAQLFMECAREVAKSLAQRNSSETAGSKSSRRARKSTAALKQ
jgi:DNA-binding transcriptional LysR family regulator